MTAMNLDKWAVRVRAEAVPYLPADEKWNLTSRLKRAAQSIPANIAEGHERFHFLGNVRFCCFARGSLTEVQSQISLACEPGCLPKEIYKRMTAYAESLGKQLNNYIAYLKRSRSCYAL